MKAFTKTNKITYNLVSYTGFKSLLLFSLLIKEAKTYDEMKEFFRNNEYLKEDLSEDTLRVYLTSLKRVGCVVERTSSPLGAKFKIVSHPYEFKLFDNHIKAIIKIYKILVQTAEVRDILAFDNFIKKIAEQIESRELDDAISQVSLFKNIDKNLMKDLIDCVNKGEQIKILYNSPKSSEKEISVITDKLTIEKNNIYLNGINLEYSQDSSFLVTRIKKILEVVPAKERIPVDIPIITVGYELSTFTPDVKLEDNEQIVEIKDESVIIEAQTTNLFMMKRRILEFGPLCTVLYPEDFRQDVIDTLRNMQEGYLNDKK